MGADGLTEDETDFEGSKCDQGPSAGDCVDAIDMVDGIDGEDPAIVDDDLSGVDVRLGLTIFEMNFGSTTVRLNTSAKSPSPPMET